MGEAEKKKTVVQMTRRGVWVWCALALFTAGWMFVLGILVGRGTAPVTLQTDRLEKELAKLKASILLRQQAEIEAQASGQSNDKPELGFYEALKKDAVSQKQLKVLPDREGQDAPKAGSEKTAPDKMAVLEKPASPQPVAAVVQQPPSKTEKTAAAVEKPKPRNESEPALKAGRLTIQVAALKEAHSADRLVDSLRKKGYPAYHIQTSLKEKGVWYRVRVGAFSERDDAARTLKKLEKDRIKGWIVATP